MKFKICLSFLLYLTIKSTSFSQNTVYINVPGGNEGRGILKSRGNECFVITPHHVVNDALEDINIIGEKKVKSVGSIEKPYSTNDLAILRVDKGGIQKCTEWMVESDFEKIIESNSSGFVEYREADGSSQKAEVEIIGVNGEEIQIQRKDAMSVFVKGWSGSSLFVNQNGQRIYLGMLYQLQGRAGYVMRADHMFNVMTSFFGKEEREAQSGNPESDIISGNFNNSAGVLREMETKQVKLAITKFEQNNNKAIFHFTLTNKNAAQQSVIYRSYVGNFNLIDQNGISHNATQMLLGNSDDRVELIYNNPVKCSIEFEVGMNKITKAAKLQLNGYDHEFKFFNIELLGHSINNLKNEKKNNDSMPLGTLMTKMVKLTVDKFEQNNNKAIFYFSLTNKNPGQQIVIYRSYVGNFNLIDQNGLSYKATNMLLGNSDDRVELIYENPVVCRIEFEVGMNKITKAAKLQLNSYEHQFVFTHLGLVSIENNYNNNLNIEKNKPINQNSKLEGIGKMDIENIRINVNSIEQIGNKLIFYYSYENIDVSNQIKAIRTYTGLNKLKINGVEITSGFVSLGSDTENAELVYQVPVPCYAEFDIGALQPTQIESLKLGLYNYDFEFAGTGPIGQPKSLKSMKAIEARNELIGAGVKLGWDLLTKKKN